MKEDSRDCALPKLKTNSYASNEIEGAGRMVSRHKVKPKLTESYDFRSKMKDEEIIEGRNNPGGELKFNSTSKRSETRAPPDTSYTAT